MIICVTGPIAPPKIAHHVHGGREQISANILAQRSAALLPPHIQERFLRAVFDVGFVGQISPEESTQFVLVF
jgi:hypothetical protein